MAKRELISGVIREDLFEGRIAIFTLSGMTTEIVDVWINSCYELMQQCLEENHPLLVLQDLSHPDVEQTTYSRQVGKTLTNAFPELGGRIAFVVIDNPENRKIQRFVHSQRNEYRERQVFFSRNEAITWLQELLTENDSDT